MSQTHRFRCARVEWIEEIDEDTLEITIDLPYPPYVVSKEDFAATGLVLGDAIPSVLIDDRLNEEALSDYSTK